MTGRNPMRLGVAYATIMPWQNIGIHPDEHFMPQSFLAAGYQTAMVGKWHLGHSQQTYVPNERGFEHFYGHLHTEVGYYPPFANQGGKDFQRNGVSIDDDGYESFLLADEVSRFIRERDRSRPFFIYMPMIAPHTPLDAPPELQEKYKDINTDLAPARSAQTDGTAYSVGGAGNAPLRGGKGETFEGGIRVVAVMRWPGRVPAGAKMDQIMTAMDVFPTLADAAGIEMKNTFSLDGSSLWPAISKGAKAPRDEFVFLASETPIYGHFNLTLFNDHWKLVQEIEQDQLTTTVTNHLFNIAEDPNEYNNRASAHPGMPPSKFIERILDMQHGARGRLTYDCETQWYLGGLCLVQD
jgi:arylsulfatase A-like enzyme